MKHIDKFSKLHEVFDLLQIGDELLWEPLRLTQPGPWTGHLVAAFWLIKAVRPRVLVELGTHSGNSYSAFCQAIALLGLPACAFAVDTWSGDEHAGFYDERVFSDLNSFNENHFAGFSKLLRTTFDEARGYFANGSIDLLHIDGLHTYEAVKHDFETWRSAASPSAVVVFHDTNVRERGFGVWKLWRELAECFPSFEFHHSEGLGVLGLGPNQSPLMSRLYELGRDPEASALVRRLFATRGDTYRIRVREMELRDKVDWLSQDVEKKTHRLMSLQEELGSRDATARDQAQTLQLKDAHLRERDSQIAGLTQAIGERDSQIAGLTQAVGERDSQIAGLTQAVGERESQLAGLTQALDERDSQIAGLTQALDERDSQIAGLTRAVVERDDRIEESERTLAELKENSSQLELRLSQSTEHACRLQKDLISGRQQVALIESSISWRATSFLRTASKKFPRIRRFNYRLLRLLWYILTLQLPSRLRTRRRLLQSQRTIAGSELFDATWYLQNYPDVAAAEIDPASHYAMFGATERRNPGPRFDATWYLDHNPDVAAAGLNPLLHYLYYGHSEGRQARAPQRSETVEINRGTIEATQSLAAKAAMSGLQLTRLRVFLSGTAVLELPFSNAPDVTIVLVLRNRAELTFACLMSIRECLSGSDVGIEVVILDNGSTDLTSDLLARVRGAKIIRKSENLHFLRGVNLATVGARGRAILLLNNDAQLFPGSLEAAADTLESAADIGAVGARIILPDGLVQEAGSIIWRDGTCVGYGRGRSPNDPEVMFRRDVDYCSGAFLLTRRELFERLNGFDECFVPAYYEEVDYCVRLWQAGFRVVYEPDAVIMHYEFGSASSSDEALSLQSRNHRLFYQKHEAWLSGREAFSQENMLLARTVHQTRKRVLVIEDRVPHPRLGRGYPRSLAIVRALLEEGAQVTFFPMFPTDDSWSDVRSTLDSSVEVFLGSTSNELRDCLERRRSYFDAILVCRPHNMRVFLGVLDADRSLVSGAQIIYDAEAIFAARDILRRELAGEVVSSAEASRMLAEEIGLTKAADNVLSVSAKELALFLENGVRRVFLLGYPIKPDPTISEFEARSDILFVGALSDDESPNAESLRWFAHDVLPYLREELRSDVRLKVVGLNLARSIEKLDGSYLDLVGSVDDLKSHFEKARVFVVPTRFAAGIPLKALEAAGYGVPMVVTSLIASQLGWQVGRDVLAASDGPSFATECARLYNSRALWNSLRCHALERVQEDCSPERFRETIRTVLAQGVSRPICDRSTPHVEEAGERNAIPGPSDAASTVLPSPYLQTFANALFAAERSQANSNLNYVFRASEQLDASKLCIKAIAFYLPQFHPIPENDRWWGKGFTEWNNVTRAVPQFLGHYQPHLPGDLGFYDLRLPSVMQEQVNLAKQYGISGFCFHYYYFGGRTLLEKPLKQFLHDASLDLRFCICWANENWTRRWDGSDQDVLMAQDYSPDNDRAFIQSLLPYFTDQRYICIDGKPLLIVYRIDLLPSPLETIALWRDLAKHYGFPDIYIVAARTFGLINPRQYGVDAAVEFPPHQTLAPVTTKSYALINTAFCGAIHDYKEIAGRFGTHEWDDLLTFKTVFPSWDNEARKPGRATIYAGSNPELFAGWLRDACHLTAHRTTEEKLVFVNAWNEWAEGAHLEPDRKFGYAYLHAMSAVLRSYYRDEEVDTFVLESNAHFERRSAAAIILHCYHEDLALEISQRYLKPHTGEVDIIATVRRDSTIELLKELQTRHGNVLFVQVENRGRDIKPFLQALAIVEHLGYEFCCKIHTKKSLHLKDEGRWRESLLSSLLGPEDSVRRVLQIFSRERDVGLLVPDGSLTDLSIKDTHNGNIMWLDKLLKKLGRPQLIGSYQILFPAGSMYWFRVSALAGLGELEREEFELEVGQRDGTLAHAIERIVGLYALIRGYRTRELRLGSE
jgi:O-antigen biosynthesis protein